jgi:hypothetical protein
MKRERTTKELLEALDRFKGKFVESASAVGNVSNNLVAHARFPKLFEMIGDARYGLVVRIAGEEHRNLVRHVNHVFFFHEFAGRRI